MRKHLGLYYKTKSLISPLSRPGPHGAEPHNSSPSLLKDPYCHHHLLPQQGTSWSPHLLLRQPRGAQQPCALQESKAAYPGAGAERWLREPDQKFHLEAAPRQGLSSSLRRQRQGKGGLVQELSRDGSQFEFLPKDGQQFT